MNDDDHSNDSDRNEGDVDDDVMLELLAWCARQFVRDPAPQPFIERLALHGPAIFPEFFGNAGADRADASRFFRSFGWSIASRMPIPSLGFRPNKLTLPGRNDPCLCGSLRKYKHCCAAIVPTFPALDDALLGGLVIEALPRREWAALPASRVPLRMVAAAAELLCDADRDADAARLLEGWSKLPPPWPDARADLLDLLGDIYLDLEKPRKRKQLAQAMVANGGPAVQSKGWQRLCLLATDAGDEAGARRAFEAAQRLAPNDPSVALLEVTTLAGQGELARARERADFHARRLSRLPHASELADAIAALTELSKEGSRLERELKEFGGQEGDPVASFASLQTWLADLPEPRLQLSLPKQPAVDLGPLQPTPAARKALARWHDAFEFRPPTMTWEVPGDDAAAILEVDKWLPVLRAHPLLADCFEVLDGLLLALQILPVHMTVELQLRLMDRALALWAALRERQPGARCEWGHLANRPALRLLAHRIELERAPLATESFVWLQHIVEVLNPHDNHGFRDRLAAVYLRRGETDRALALCERYPDDRVGMRLLHARALLARRETQAAAALVDAAVAENPHLRKLLLASRAPRQPNVPSYALGSLDEAKIVVAEQFDLWRDDPVIRQWIRQRLDPAQAATADLFAAPDGNTPPGP